MGFIIAAAVAAAIIAFCFLCYKKAPPTQAIVVTGFGLSRPKVVCGRGVFVLPIVQRADRLNMRLLKIDVKTPETGVKTKEGVSLWLDSVVTVQVYSENSTVSDEEVRNAGYDDIRKYINSRQQAAISNFLGMDEAHINEKINDVLQGNLREIVSEMTVDQILTNRKQMAVSVVENARPDLAKMGLEVVTFNVQDVKDAVDAMGHNHGVIEAIGVEQEELVKKRASIAKAEAERDVSCAKAAAAMAANEKEIEAQTAIAQRNNELELAKSKLDEVFWKHCETELGFAVPAPNVDKLKISLFVTSLAHSVKVIPDAWQPFAAAKPGSVLAFMDGMMNNVNYGEAFDAMAAAVQDTLHAKAALAKLPHDLLTDCECLPCVDDLLTGWMTERLQAEDVTAALNGESIPELCQRRAKTHFGRKLAVQYAMLESAWHIVSAAHYRAPADHEHVWAQYYREDYKIDAQYRAFYTAYDKLDEPAAYDKLQGLVENIYNTEYLAKIIPAWNTDFPQEPGMGRMALQRNFFSECVAGNKERTVVIISDAMRYEVGAELAALLAEDPKSTVQLTPRLGVLPSYTRLGMAALLPHTRMEMTPEYQVLIDDMPCENLAQRQAVLQKRVPQSGCIQFDDLKAMKKDDLRAVFTGKQVVYIYHNQIDARGDKPNTEDEVFAACREAVEEIAAMIRRIAGSANTLHFIVTADHGFLYKRHALAESDKIPNTAPKTAFVNRRFIVDADPIAQPGVASLPMATVLNTKTNMLTVSYPTAANVFKVAGGGENYVHGGSSPQEMIVPVLDVRMEKGRMETTTVQLTLVSILKKITNLITALDFMQNEPISDTVRETTFRVYFVGEDNERISNENIVVADKRGETAAERMFRLRFSFKNRKYDNKKPYYLVAYDDKNSVEVLRRQVVMDIAMADDFGFGF